MFRQGGKELRTNAVKHFPLKTSCGVLQCPCVTSYKTYFKSLLGFLFEMNLRQLIYKKRTPHNNPVSKTALHFTQCS